MLYGTKQIRSMHARKHPNHQQGLYQKHINANVPVN